MKAIIEIECDTIGELSSHLLKIRDDIVSLVSVAKLDWEDEQIPAGLRLDDDNCYGSHKVLLRSK